MKDRIIAINERLTRIFKMLESISADISWIKETCNESADDTYENEDEPIDSFSINIDEEDEGSKTDRFQVEMDRQNRDGDDEGFVLSKREYDEDDKGDPLSYNEGKYHDDDDEYDGDGEDEDY